MKHKNCILVLIVIILFNTCVFAEESKIADVNFELTTAQWPSLISSKNLYNTSTPITLENDLFEKAYPYMWYGNGSDNRFDSNVAFELDIPEYTANDAIYVMFYYKSFSTFTGLDGNVYTCPESTPMNHIRDSKERLLNFNTGGLGDFAFNADDQWHKVECYITGDRFADEKNTMYIFNTFLSKPMYFLISDIRVGVLHAPNGQKFNNDYSYTYIGWKLQEQPDCMYINGKKININSDESEYTVSSNEDIANITLDEKSLCSVSGIKKVALGKYEVTVETPAYSKGDDDDYKVVYRKRINAQTGEFLSNGNIVKYEVENGLLYKKYYINLQLPSAIAQIKIGKEEKTSLSGCSGGEEISFKVTFNNEKKKKTTYVCILAICKDDSPISIIPKRQIVEETDSFLEKTYNYVLPDKDYTDLSIKYYIIDCDTMSNISL